MERKYSINLKSTHFREHIFKGSVFPWPPAAGWLSGAKSSANPDVKNIPIAGTQTETAYGF
ncbi:hypothetical protein [Mucilaginibacter sp. FT3.2]|uniref:hypothetical protein n=1 Tax=Mucilaginibacter sp. FT3.2 TaxID=2723090 RepID=UPI001617676F|nr:hypothetical protein [Mucilaginibacter sp. FT3.2]MBB6230683.1 hypothetical protein [Mucilaginibacter sp. FT3.2]